MSRQRDLRLLGLAASVWGAGGCLDPGQRYQAFSERVVDAAPSVRSCGLSGDLPDVTGEFYLALSPSLAPDSFLRFIVAVDLSREGSAISFSFQPLCSRSGDEDLDCGADYLVADIGDAIVVANNPVRPNGGFDALLKDVEVGGKANPISGGDIFGSISLFGCIVDSDNFCGDVDGTLQRPIPNLGLTGSTFGAIRIAPGTRGDALPAPVAACIE